ncbi:MAG TPA: sterol desaturase family protein [Chitinophagaceae bacterium]|nr:sterol desaturase family protein [Chitinophagaceae bacterium]HPH31657.1 sterol desaturase family protein [Chitinophagaceae bacterium]
METYGKILLIAMPAFLVLVLFEKWWGWRKGFDTVRNMDMISSLSSGITNVTKSVLEITIAIGIYPFMLQYLALTQIENTVLVYILTFIIIDFNGYWVHRWSHEVNLFWNLHVIHHSSEEYNLACALRQSISAFFNMFTVLLLPAALLGIPEQVIATVAPLQLFAQFWYHTRHINKMGFLEKIIVTPSHHRVHHAVNPEYMDKNLSQIFIIWDKLFGTFQEELKEVPPVYGISRPAKTWNPIRINFQHLWLMIKDAWRTNNWKDKFTLWFRRTGYRPADVAAKYPVYKIEDVYHFEKYDTRTSPAFTAWAWVQLTLLLLSISYLFGNIAYINSIDSSYIYWYGAFVFLTVYALTELMDRNSNAMIWEVLRCGLGCWFLYQQGDWFGAGFWLANIKYILAVYFIVSLFAAFYFTMKHKKEDSASFAT